MHWRSSAVLFGHGAAFLPTAVTTVPGNTSLVVQVYVADYLRLRPDPKDDTPITAPLRKIAEDPGAFSEALLRSAYATLDRSARH